MLSAIVQNLYMVKPLKVELIYIAEDQTVFHQHLLLETGATVDDAIKSSGILITHPEVQALAVGVFAKQVSRDTVLKTGDRVEIYRKLSLDPKEKRRRKV